MHFVVCLPCCNDCVLLGLNWAKPMMFLSLHVICHAFSCIRTFKFLYLYIYIYIYNLVDAFLIVSLSLSLPLSLFLASVASWHPNANPFHPRTLFILGHLLPLTPLHLTFGSMMRRLIRTSRRTFLDEAFIRNAKSSYQNFPILTYPLSSTVGVGSHYVAPRSLALS